MSVRRFGVLVRGLPAEARTWASKNGGWSISDHLLATNAELTHAVFRAVLASIPRKPGASRRLPKPFTIERPGMKKQKKSWIREWAAHASGRRQGR